jgi:hypothetical protein
LEVNQGFNFQESSPTMRATDSPRTVAGGDVAVWFGELDEPHTLGQLRVRALDPELVWLAHEHEPWQPRHEA